MKPLIAFAALLMLAACGADGPPLPPAKAATGPVTVSGEARIGVVAEF
jgi:predicted small lipoprotein YifL